MHRKVLLGGTVLGIEVDQPGLKLYRLIQSISPDLPALPPSLHIEKLLVNLREATHLISTL